MPQTPEHVCLANMKREIEQLTSEPRMTSKALNLPFTDKNLDVPVQVPNSNGSLYKYSAFHGGDSQTIAFGTAAGMIAYDHYEKCLATPAVPNHKPSPQHKR